MNITDVILRNYIRNIPHPVYIILPFEHHDLKNFTECAMSAIRHAFRKHSVLSNIIYHDLMNLDFKQRPNFSKVIMKLAFSISKGDGSEIHCGCYSMR